VLQYITDISDAGVALSQVCANSVVKISYFLKSGLGQKRRFDRLPFTSGLPPSTDIVGVHRHVAKVPGADFAPNP
jgi:hypothetical protein